MEFFGINPGEALVLLTVIALVLGPRQLLGFIRRLYSVRQEISRFSAAARQRFSAETSSLTQQFSDNASDISDLADLQNAIANPKEYIRAQVAEEMDSWIKLLHSTEIAPEDIIDHNHNNTCCCQPNKPAKVENTLTDKEK